MNQLSSDRLNYEKLARSHFDHYVSVETDPEVMKFLRRPMDLKSVEERFEKNLKYAEDQPGYGIWSVFNKDNNEFIGIGAFVHIERNVERGKVEVGYVLTPKSWGQGYALEIAQTLIKYGFEEMKLKELWGTTEPSHLKSQNVLVKAGMIPIGIMEFHGTSMVFKIKNPNQ